MKCIRIKATGLIERVCEEIAQRRVMQNEAEFVPKHEWRAQKSKTVAVNTAG